MQNFRCPYCDNQLEIKITRKHPCPHCHMDIYVRSGRFVTEDESITIDWLVNLENCFNIDRKFFENERDRLSKRFSKRASANDTVWMILNQLIVTNASNNSTLASVYGFMADLLADEDKDPSDILFESAKARNKANFQFMKSHLESKKWMAEMGVSSDNYDLEKIQAEILNLQFEDFSEEDLVNNKPLFLGHAQLSYIRRLAKNNKFEKAEGLLYKSEPSPAVLDELRKIASRKAKIAKENCDWERVVYCLDKYTDYANEWRDHCRMTVNQEPPEHTERDKNLFHEAMERINK